MSFDHLFTAIPRGKFEPVLDFRRRCQILALLRRGINAATLSQHYGVNRHTVHSIGRDTSPHYRNVRSEYDTLGREAFERRHLDEDTIRAVLVVQRGDVEARQGFRPRLEPMLFNPRAKASAGHHDTQDVGGFPLSIDIEWGQPIDGQPKAWYYREDGGEAAGPYYTSALALRGACESKTQEELDAS